MQIMDQAAEQIRLNIQFIQERIQAAAKRSGRAGKDITLLAVTKNVSVPEIRTALEAGVSVLGENKVQEAKEKFSQIGPAVAWHMLGHLQTNKTRPAAAIFDCVQSIDSQRLADALDREARALDRQMAVLVEVNLGEEEAKFGVPLSEVDSLAHYVAAKPNLRLRGLMGMVPFTPEAEITRPLFRSLAARFQTLKELLPRPEFMTILSMGMTHDFEIAIEEGATLVRIGTGIFRARDSRRQE